MKPDTEDTPMYVSAIIEFAEGSGRLTWIPCSSADLHKYQPIEQAYGVCFDSRGRILVILVNKKIGWTLPGGKPEPGEALEQTLAREFLEEAQVAIKAPVMLGVQKVEQNDRVFYQARFICQVDKVLRRKADPAEGKLHPRRFIPSEKITQWVKWKGPGDAMFQDAIRTIGL
jgi:8-oxo-dGTP pyrophosphatase MutT (NUDIX family)